MKKDWNPLDIKVYKSWVEAILDEASDELNDWESEFVESIAKRLESHKNLTEGQAIKLESIYAIKTK